MLENKQTHPRRLSSPSLSLCFPLTQWWRATPPPHTPHRATGVDPSRFIVAPDQPLKSVTCSLSPPLLPLIVSSGFLRLSPLPKRHASPRAPGPKKKKIIPPALRRALRRPPRACQAAVSHFRGGCSDTLEVSEAPHTAVGCSVAGRRLCMTTTRKRR